MQSGFQWKIAFGSTLLMILVLVLYKPFSTLGQEQETEPAGDSFEQAVAEIEAKYLNKNLSLDEAVSEYHKKINDMFNARMELLAAGNKPEKFDPPNIDPDEHCQKMKAAGKLSLRTYCLAVEAANEFDGYARALIVRKNAIDRPEQACLEEVYEKHGEELRAKLSPENKKNLQPDEIQQLENELKRWNDIQSKVITDVLLNSNNTQAFIDREIEMSSFALDKAIAAYNEFQTAYPLHLEYEKMIVNLEKYRDALARVRDKITEFPGKFINATTTQCT